jgi:hypothetical protein
VHGNLDLFSKIDLLNILEKPTYEITHFCATARYESFGFKAQYMPRLMALLPFVETLHLKAFAIERVPFSPNFEKFRGINTWRYLIPLLRAKWNSSRNTAHLFLDS